MKDMIKGVAELIARSHPPTAYLAPSLVEPFSVQPHSSKFLARVLHNLESEDSKAPVHAASQEKEPLGWLDDDGGDDDEGDDSTDPLEVDRPWDGEEGEEEEGEEEEWYDKPTRPSPQEVAVSSAKEEALPRKERNAEDTFAFLFSEDELMSGSHNDCVLGWTKRGPPAPCHSPSPTPAVPAATATPPPLAPIFPAQLAAAADSTSPPSPLLLSQRSHDAVATAVTVRVGVLSYQLFDSPVGRLLQRLVHSLAQYQGAGQGAAAATPSAVCGNTSLSLEQWINEAAAGSVGNSAVQQHCRGIEAPPYVRDFHVVLIMAQPYGDDVTRWTVDDAHQVVRLPHPKNITAARHLIEKAVGTKANAAATTAIHSDGYPCFFCSFAPFLGITVCPQALDVLLVAEPIMEPFMYTLLQARLSPIQVRVSSFLSFLSHFYIIAAATALRWCCGMAAPLTP